jgi:internalin A
MLAESRSRRPRRFLRFSVRGTISLVLIIGAGLGWLVRSAHIQRDAVAAIERVGGTVLYNWQWKNGSYFGGQWKNGSYLSGGNAWAPRWLVDFIGVDYFGHVTYVAVVLPPYEVDALIAQVGCLTELERLSLSHSPVGDVRLARLKGLAKIEYLDLRSTRLTDDGLVNLASLRNLSALLLTHTYVTDAGRKRLKRSLPRVTIVN